jgi:hypothetical protein
MSNACTLFAEKPEGKRTLGRPRCRFEENIKMDLVRSDGVVWNVLIWLRIENSGGLLRTQ